MCCIKQVLFVVQIIIRDSKGLSEDQMKEFRSSFNHFDKVCLLLPVHMYVLIPYS